MRRSPQSVWTMPREPPPGRPCSRMDESGRIPRSNDRPPVEEPGSKYPSRTNTSRGSLSSTVKPTAPSIETTANHVGFSVNDYDAYKAKLAEIGAAIFFENAEEGQILADLPDGVRIEILTDPEQEAPIAFHHYHLSVPQAEELRGWYLDVFSAEAGERRNLPSALVPGGRVDFIPARGEPAKPSRGGAIDHIGFEVADMDAFAAHVESLGIEFDRGPMHVDAIGLTIAFFTDPAGTYIEVTQGLAAVE